ncbi:hypothetical protein QYE76_047024 [Lolium multiflorum]|uniref:Uncharacterized protein n=1 Tax=Lolium multiflorum TaxID=4521 RepID=A0AAD8X183_LOLMU|nr:hypothetical protein QYE76_047024 [Lolium multiflorum]
MAAGDLDWERSKISNQDLNLMKKLGLMKKDDAIRFPSEESYPNPPMEYRVSFVDHLIRGLSAPIHDFLRGLLFVYGIQLHQVQPLQARKNPLWTYTGVNDANRLSSDLSAKDLEKLIRRISRLNKKDPVPSSCRVVPYSSTNPLPENHPTMSSLPPLPEDGEVEEQAVVAEDNQGSSLHESEVAGSHKSAASHEKEIESEASESTQSLPPAVSPKNKRKRDDAEASGTSKPEKTVPSRPGSAYDPYLETLISSDDEEVLPSVDVATRTTRTAQEFQLEEPVNDPLLDALSFLEVHGSEAREGIDQAKAGLSRLFPYFFPKKEEPATFVDLAKSFNSAEDLGLKMRQENMKVAVESTVALVADSRQTIDWMKLIFDNYSPIPDPPEVFPSSLSKKSSVPVNFDDSSSMDLIEELKELRVQLQSVKKQSLILMEQSRESSEKEKIALQRAQDAISERDTAVAEADAAASRENSMLQLLTDASLDMADAFGNVIRRTYFNLSPSGDTNITPAPAPSNLLDPSKFMVQVLDKSGGPVFCSSIHSAMKSGSKNAAKVAFWSCERIQIEVVLGKFPGYSWHVSWTPCEDSPVLTEELDERAFLCDIHVCGNGRRFLWICRVDLYLF